MKLLTLAAMLALSACAGAQSRPETEGQRIHRLICTGPINDIPDDDPALAYFMDRDESFEDHKVALAIERANSCDDEDDGRPRGQRR